MSDDIVYRLRESAEFWAHEVVTRIEGADEIERLRAERDALRAALERLMRAPWATPEYQDAFTQAIATLERNTSNKPEVSK